jgi:hypothetical protein
VLMSRLRFVLGTLCVYGLATHAAFPHTTNAVAMPVNIIVDQRLEGIVARMLHRSSTFRAQCAYLGRVAALRVNLVVRLPGPPFKPSRCRAEALIRKYEFGWIEALVRLPSPVNAPELISHEFEHVREFVEGTNYRLLSVNVHTGVWRTADGHYETARAVAAGERVAAEVGPGSN